MRLIATFFTLIGLVATGVAGKDLHAALSQATPQVAPAQLNRAVQDVTQDATEAQTYEWPALFGVPVPPAPEPEPQPPAPVVAEPQPPAPARPPLSSLGYTLKGVVQAGDAVWGLVSHPSGEQILRVGDVLQDDMTIARIDATGLWVDTGREDPELLGFAE